MKSIKKRQDNRDKLWAKMELSIQKRAGKKDKLFVLKGKWKKFLRKQGGLKIYAVDAEWVRNNLSVIFGHGGHGFVHEFIPRDEIWVATHRIPHFEENYCLNKKGNERFSKKYFESAVIHEIAECKQMKRGMSYWRAHQFALEKEKENGLLEDSCDVYIEKDV